METEQKTCKNCKYYRQHYVITRLNLSEVDCGHCRKRLAKTGMFADACKHWEDNSNSKKETEKFIIDYIKNISEKLKEITMILKAVSE